ncbi:unnamed protein product [Cochlearia groenlandica]
MTNLTLNLNINSASDLKNVNLMTKMSVYAVVTLPGEKSKNKQTAKTNRCSGGGSPKWNHAVKFSVEEKLAREGGLAVELFSHRVFGDKSIGKIEVPLVELLRSHKPLNNGNGEGMSYVTYPVKTRSGSMKGYVTLSYRFDSESKPVKKAESKKKKGQGKDHDYDGHTASSIWSLFD